MKPFYRDNLQKRERFQIEAEPTLQLVNICKHTVSYFGNNSTPNPRPQPSLDSVFRDEKKLFGTPSFHRSEHAWQENWKKLIKISTSKNRHIFDSNKSLRWIAIFETEKQSTLSGDSKGILKMRNWYRRRHGWIIYSTVPMYPQKLSQLNITLEGISISHPFRRIQSKKWKHLYVPS